MCVGVVKLRCVTVWLMARVRVCVCVCVVVLVLRARVRVRMYISAACGVYCASNLLCMTYLPCIAFASVGLDTSFGSGFAGKIRLPLSGCRKVRRAKNSLTIVENDVIIGKVHVMPCVCVCVHVYTTSYKYRHTPASVGK